MARLEGKCAVITGATSGLGEATAIMFAKEGARVVCTGRNQEKGDALIEKITAAGGEAYFIAGDMRKKEDVVALHDFALEKLGKVNVLMNSAGVLVHKPFLEQNDDDFNLVTELHQHLELTVRLKARQHAAGVEIIEEFASELQIKLVPKLSDTLPDVFRLDLEVLGVVEPVFHKKDKSIRVTKLIFFIGFCKSIRATSLYL